MNATSQLLLKIMRFLAWLVFIVLLIKAGGIMMSFGVSIDNPEVAKDLYRGLDLSRYETYNLINYSIIVFYYILLYFMLAYIALFATKLLSTINLEKPFSKTVAGLLKKISFTVLGVLIIAIVHNIHLLILEKYAAITPEYISMELIFLAGTVYMLAELFKRGVEMQIEKESTI